MTLDEFMVFIGSSGILTLIAKMTEWILEDVLEDIMRRNQRDDT